MAIDAAGLHQGYLRAFAKRGGKLWRNAEALSVSPDAGGVWRVETRAGAIEAAVLVNAAGAWGDDVARLAGVAPIGLQPKRRTAVLLDPPGAQRGLESMPMVTDIDDDFYVKPEGDALMVSPADETPAPPADIQPEELDVAIAVDRFERLTGSSVRSLRRRWAGLRSFVSDHSPVIGFDNDMPAFFWLVGQGGFGIMTAPGAAGLAAGLIERRAQGPAFERTIPKVAPARRR